MRPGNIFEAPPPKGTQPSTEHITSESVAPLRSSNDSKKEEDGKIFTAPPTALTSAPKPWADLSRLVDACPLINDEPWPSTSPPPELKANYSIYNPSICLHPTKSDRMMVVLRSANYAVTDDYRYVVQTGERGVMTENFLTEIDVPQSKEAKTIFHHRGLITTPKMPFPNPHIGGFEDVRLQWEPVSKKMFATFTSLEMEARGMPAISLTELDLEKNIMSQPVLLRGPQPAKPKEKNWMSFTMDGRLLLIYSINPLVVLEADPKTGNCTTIQEDNPASSVPLNWRGSSPLCPMPASLIQFLPGSESKKTDAIESKTSAPKSKSAKKREKERTKKAQPEAKDEQLDTKSKEDAKEVNERYFIALGHTGDWPRYAQMFLVFKADSKGTLKLTHYSSRFIFEKYDIEYSLGLALTPNGKELIMPYSIRDRICRCARIDPSILLPRLNCVSS